MVRTIWGDDERFKKTYFPEEFNGKYYMAGDSAHRDESGYFWIMGRVDDVLNVSGHRLGTMEIESALVANPLVADRNRQPHADTDAWCRRHQTGLVHPAGTGNHHGYRR